MEIRTDTSQWYSTVNWVACRLRVKEWFSSPRISQIWVIDLKIFKLGQYNLIIRVNLETIARHINESIWTTYFSKCRLMLYKVLLNYILLCLEFKKFKANLNINTQITIHVCSLPWHSGKVLKWIGIKSSRCRQFETNEERK